MIEIAQLALPEGLTMKHSENKKEMNHITLLANISISQTENRLAME